MQIDLSRDKPSGVYCLILTKEDKRGRAAQQASMRLTQEELRELHQVLEQEIVGF